MRRHRRDKGITAESGDDCGEDRKSIFAGSRDIAADGKEALGTPDCSKGTGDFLFYLDHADILFGAVIGKGDIEVVKESHYPRFMVFQAIQEVLGL